MANKKPKLGYRIAVVILGFALVPQPAAGAETKFSHRDASESGAFNFGHAEASVSLQTDSETQSSVLKLDYSVGKDGASGVWTKGYHANLSRQSTDRVRIRVHLSQDASANEITLKAELKGTDEIQIVELQPAHGWSETQAPIQWDRMGRCH